MPRLLPLLITAALGVAALQAASQQLLQPQTRPVVTPPITSSPSGRTSHTLASDPGQRPASDSPVPSEGPAKMRAPGLAAPPPQAGTTPSPTRVFDASGRPLNGMLRVGPHRALDPRTGRFYQTTPGGKLVESPPLPAPPPPDR
jgi:hypothetical protein